MFLSLSPFFTCISTFFFLLGSHTQSHATRNDGRLAASRETWPASIVGYTIRYHTVFRVASIGAEESMRLQSRGCDLRYAQHNTHESYATSVLKMKANKQQHSFHLQKCMYIKIIIIYYYYRWALYFMIIILIIIIIIKKRKLHFKNRNYYIFFYRCITFTYKIYYRICLFFHCCTVLLLVFEFNVYNNFIIIEKININDFIANALQSHLSFPFIFFRRRSLFLPCTSNTKFLIMRSAPKTLWHKFVDFCTTIDSSENN